MAVTTEQWFAVPGGWLLDLVLPDIPFDDEGRAALDITAGLLFWCVVAVIGYLVATRVAARRRLRSRLSSPPAVGERDLVPAAVARTWSDVRTRAAAWTWADAWGATWRAQVAHLGLYAAVPLAWEAARTALFIVFLPFTIMSFSDQKRDLTDGTLDHLRDPRCWTFVTPCAGPRSQRLHTPVVYSEECRDGSCPPARSLVTDLGGVGWKVLWAALSFAWILAWLRRRPGVGVTR